MQIKGTAVRTTEQFMKKMHPDKLFEWKKNLPSESKPFFKDVVNFTKWYPLTESVIYPTETVAKVLNLKKEEAAKELGHYSAIEALKGVYKIFIRISSPQFVISRASQVFSTYYDEAQINIIEKGDKYIKAELIGFEEKDELIIYRITGWMEGTLEATSKKSMKSEIEINKLISGYITANVRVFWD